MLGLIRARYSDLAEFCLETTTLLCVCPELQGSCPPAGNLFQHKPRQLCEGAIRIDEPVIAEA